MAPARPQERTPIPELDVLWITAGLGCDGDTIAMTAATQPSIEEIVLGDATNHITIPDSLAATVDSTHGLTVIGGSGSDTIDASALAVTHRVVIYAGGVIYIQIHGAWRRFPS